MKKKILSLGIVVLLIIMMVALTGCGNYEQENTNSQKDSNVKEQDEGADTILKFNEYIMNNDYESACNLMNIEESNKYLEISYSQSEYIKALENLSNSLAHQITNIEKIDSEDEYNKTDYANEVSYQTYKEEFKNASLYLVEFEANGRKFTDLYIIDEDNTIITSGIMSFSFKSRYNFEQQEKLTNNNV